MKTRIHLSMIMLIFQMFLWNQSSLSAVYDSIPKKTFGFGSVRFIEPTSDSDKIIICSDDGKLRVWDLNSGALLKTFKIPINSNSSITMLSGNTKMMIANPIREEACEFSIWDLTTESVVGTLTKNAQYFHFASASKDYSRVLSNSGNTVNIWNFNSGDSILSVPGPTTLASAVLSSDGSKLFAGYKTDECKVFDVNTGDSIFDFSGALNPYSPVTFLANGKQILGCNEKVAKVLSISDGEVIQTFSIPSGYYSALLLSPDESKMLSVSTDTLVNLWDMKTGSLIRSFRGLSSQIFDIRFTSDGQKIVAYSRNDLITIWDIGSEIPIRTISAYSSYPVSVRFSPDDKSVFVSLKDRDSTQLWEINSDSPLHYFRGIMTGSADRSISRDGSDLITVTNDSTIRIWNWRTGDSIRAFKMNGAVQSAMYTNDDSRLITHVNLQGGQNCILLVDALKGDSIQALYKRNDSISGFTVSPDFTKILIIKDSVAIMRNIASGDSIRSYKFSKNVSSAQFSPDGLKIVFTSNHNYTDIANVNNTIITRLSDSYNVSWAAFSPDRKSIVTAGYKTARLWEIDPVPYKKYEYIISSYGETISGVFSSDGSKVLIGNNDGNVTLWDVPISTNKKSLRISKDTEKDDFTIMQNKHIIFTGNASKIPPNSILSIVTLSGKVIAKLICADYSKGIVKFNLQQSLAKGTYFYSIGDMKVNYNGRFTVVE